jgi:hypothetical protein
VVDNGDMQLLGATKAAVDAIASSWSSHLTQLIVYGEQWKQSFTDILKDIVAAFLQSILEMEIRYLAFQALTGTRRASVAAARRCRCQATAARAPSAAACDRGTSTRSASTARSSSSPTSRARSSRATRWAGGGGDVHVQQTFAVSGIDLGSEEAVRKFLRQAASQMRRGAVEAQQFARATSDQIQLQPRRAY